MERTMRRFWANLARNGDPNDDSNNFYPAGIYEQDVRIPWEPFNANNGWFVFQSGDGRPMYQENNFKHRECDFWDQWDAYLHI